MTCRPPSYNSEVEKGIVASACLCLHKSEPKGLTALWLTLAAVVYLQFVLWKIS